MDVTITATGGFAVLTIICYLYTALCIIIDFTKWCINKRKKS